MKITKDQARRFMIVYHGLDQFAEGNQKQEIISYIKKVGCIQFDPLDQVGYNPALVLQSRIAGFKNDQLNELLYKDRVLIDAWDKNMSIYPIEDWPFFKRYRDEERLLFLNEDLEVQQIIPEMKVLLEEMGPSSSLDFDFDTIVNWSWAPTKASRAALESLFYQGELLVYNKVGTRRIYDFTHKHLPLNLLSEQECHQDFGDYCQWHVLRRINALGLLWNRASDAWLGIHGMKTKERQEAFMNLLEDRALIEIEVEDLSYPLYMDKTHLPLLEKVLEGEETAKRVAFLAPLDNLLWDRKLIQELFGFEYRWEVYKPIEQRSYGYYVLPILYGETFIGRFEPRYNKKTFELQILNWWWEEPFEMSLKMTQALKLALLEFMDYLGAKGLGFSTEGKTSKVLEALKIQLNGLR